MLFVTLFLFGCSQTILTDVPPATSWPLAACWLVTLAFAACAVGISILLTVLGEEWVVAKVIKHPESGTYQAPVFRTNAVAFVVIMGGAAIRTLPARLASPDFLVLPRDFPGSLV